MKSILLSFFLIITSIALAQDLGQFGHIIDNSDVAAYQFEQDTPHPTIAYHNNSLPGNTFILLNNGFATIENTCGNTPPILRVFDKNAKLRTTRTYDQTINPKTDPSGKYIYFQNNKNTLILDTETLIEQSISSTQCITVTWDGTPIYYKSEDKQLYTPNNSIEMPFTPHAIEWSQYEQIYIFGRKQYAIIHNNQINIRTYDNGTFFESKTINGQVYWVEKRHQNNTFHFKLLHFENNEMIIEDKQSLNMAARSKDINHNRNDENLILCPMFPDSTNYPFRIGNSYAEYQWYGGQPYLHPGIDLLGVPQQEIYTPVDGVVKAIITTSGDIHWRLAMGLEDTADEQEGYLFAHLDPSTIPFTVGDSVFAGDYIGSIVEWPTSEFHHLHFARLRHQGEIWDGNWLTKDNILSDITNFKDESTPVFESLWNDQTIAFRSEDGTEILEPDYLSGSFDIICHVHDLSNDEWRLDVDSLWFELINLTDNSVMYEQEAYSYGFELDTYSTSENSFNILNTIYSTSEEWQTNANYNERQFYQQVSRSNGDGIMDDQDNVVYFDSSIFPDGNYLFRIHAYDAVKNHSFTEIEVYFNNFPTNTNDIKSKRPIIYPNPNSGQFKIKTNGVHISKGEIYNSLGQLLTDFDTVHTKEKALLINDAGIYYIKLFGLDNQLLVNQKVIIQE